MTYVWIALAVLSFLFLVGIYGCANRIAVALEKLIELSGEEVAS